MVLACVDRAASGVAEKCVALFDYFQLQYIRGGDDGGYLRAGVNGPNFGKHCALVETGC